LSNQTHDYFCRRVTDGSKIELERISREIAEKDSIIKQLEGALDDERAEKQDLLAEVKFSNSMKVLISLSSLNS